jgi:hypothetical protein
MPHRLPFQWTQQLVISSCFGPNCVTQVNEVKEENNNHEDEEIGLITSFNEEIPTRDYP